MGVAVTTPLTAMVPTDGEEVGNLCGEVETIVFGLGARDDKDPEALRGPEGVTEGGPVWSSLESSCCVCCSTGPVVGFGVPPGPTDGETLRGPAGLLVNMAVSDGRDGRSGTGLGGVVSIGRSFMSAGRSAAEDTGATGWEGGSLGAFLALMAEKGQYKSSKSAFGRQFNPLCRRVVGV